MTGKLYLATCTVALFFYIFLGHIVLQPAGIGSDPLTLKQLSFGYLTVGSFVFVYTKRKSPPYDSLWKLLRMFLFVLLGILICGYIKDRYISNKK